MDSKNQKFGIKENINLKENNYKIKFLFNFILI